MKIIELAPTDLDQISFLDAVAIVENPAIKKTFLAFKEELIDDDTILTNLLRLELPDMFSEVQSKPFYFSEEQQMLIGPLMVPNMLIDRLDNETGEPYQIYFTAESIRLLKDKLMQEEKLNKLNLNHDPSKPVEGILSETWIVEDTKLDKSALYGFSEKIGTWMGMYYIPDKDMFTYIKENFTGFSVEGSFTEKVVRDT